MTALLGAAGAGLGVSDARNKRTRNSFTLLAIHPVSETRLITVLSPR